METELWPNLVAACTAARVPLFLVNARLSERSFAGYRRFAALTQPMFASLAGVAAQTADDAARIAAAGATNVVVTGNLKFDVEIADRMRQLGRELRERFGAARPVFLAASTRDGEEALILDALARGALPDRTLTVIVPRHPQRFDEVAALLAARGIAFARRSANAAGRGRRRRRARRFAGRAAGLLRGRRRRVRRREPAAVRRPEPHRGDRGRHADARGSAHVQLRRSRRQRDRGGRRRCASRTRTR